MTTMDLSRCAFTLSLASTSVAAAAASLATTVTNSANAKALGGSALANPLAQIKIGRFEVTFLTDGYTDMPFNYFTGRSPVEIEAAAAGLFSARPTGIRIAFNQYLINDGERLILVDFLDQRVPSAKLGNCQAHLKPLALNLPPSMLLSSRICTSTMSPASSPAGASPSQTPKSMSIVATPPTSPIPPRPPLLLTS